MEQYVDYYCRNNNKELKKIVDRIIKRNFAWVAQKDYDDIYSMAEEVVWNCERNFDKNKKCKFQTWLFSCLERKIKTYITYLNRDKRTCKDKCGKPIADMHMDAIIGENGVSFKDMMTDDLDIRIHDSYYVNKYLSTLSEDAQRVLALLLKGYKPKEISQMMGYTQKRTNELILFLQANNRVSILRRAIK